VTADATTFVCTAPGAAQLVYRTNEDTGRKPDGQNFFSQKVVDLEKKNSFYFRSPPETPG
jgi:hypothetical protein